MTKNTIDLCGWIDPLSAYCFVSQLEEISRSAEEIVVYIDSQGGYADPMEKIVLSIKQCVVPIWGYAIGNCESAAFNILQFCDRRLAREEAKLLFHRGRIRIEENKQAFHEIFPFSWEPEILTLETDFDRELYAMLSRRTGLQYRQIEHFANAELHMSAHEALEMGLIDAIL